MDSLKISNLSNLAFKLVSLTFKESFLLLKLNVKGIEKTSPFKLKRFSSFSSLKYKIALFVLIIEIISSELSLKKITLSLILIFLFEN